MEDNYPPGVTGKEWQIAGPVSAGQQHKDDCGGKVKHWYNEEEWDLIDCPFSGYVDVEMYDNIEVWVCPNCGFENETELTEEDFYEGI